MAGKIDARLSELGIVLPDASAPVANYVPTVISGQFMFVSGQVTVWNGEFQYIGKVGEAYNIEEGQAAARVCGLNIIAQAKAALDGNLDRVRRVVKLGIFVNSASDFTQQPKVANGVSDLMVDVFGDRGKHARFAVGVNVLPLDVAVEVDAVIEIS